MTPLELFDMILGPVNPISRMIGGIHAVLVTNYTRASNVDRLIMVIRAFLGLDAVQFAIPINGKHSLDEVRKLLKDYGVSLFTLLHDHRNFYFSVKRTQARWAEYVLLQAGVELENELFNGRNAQYVKHGYMPIPWKNRKRRKRPQPIRRR